MNMNGTGVVPNLFDTEAEELILGTCLSDQGAFWSASDYLRGCDFHSLAHERLWEAISDKRQHNHPATPVTLKAFIDGDIELREVGGQEFLKALAGRAVSVRSLRPVLEAVRDLARRRAIINTATDLIDDAYFADREPSELCDRACEELYDAAHHGERGDGPETIESAVTKAAQAAEDAKNNPDQTFISTGLPSLDKALGGLFPRVVTVLGAAPSMGKSGLAAQIAKSAALTKKVGMLFSKEMGTEEIATRYIGQAAGIPTDRIEVGRISDDEVKRIAMAPENFRGLPLWIDGTPDLSVAQIRARSHAMRRKAGKLDFIVVDHLRFIEPVNRRDDEKEQLQQITKGLKRLAKEMNIAVLVVAHLNRDFWKRIIKRPQTSDLYGSSAIEQNADHIWFLHREEFFLEREKPDQGNDKAYAEWLTKMSTHEGKAEIYSTKRRGGPLGSAIVAFNAKLVQFAEIEKTLPVDAAGLLP